VRRVFVEEIKCNLMAGAVAGLELRVISSKKEA
jgi:hypothetical protein